MEQEGGRNRSPGRRQTPKIIPMANLFRIYIAIPPDISSSGSSYVQLHTRVKFAEREGLPEKILFDDERRSGSHFEYLPRDSFLCIRFPQVYGSERDPISVELPSSAPSSCSVLVLKRGVFRIQNV